MFDHDEMKRLRFFEGLRFAVAFAAIMAAMAAVAIWCSGCATGPDGIFIDKTVWVYVTNRVDKAVEIHSPVPDDATGDDPVQEVPGGSMGTPSDGGASSGTGDSSLKLDYRYGGFKGGNAKEDSRCRISNFKMGKSGCSLKWDTSIPGDWARDKDGLIIAAIFYQDGGGRWIGGKFDWIDRSRSTRDFKNIDSGYNGWNASAFHSAKKHGFCVVSADGKYRSNFIED